MIFSFCWGFSLSVLICFVLIFWQKKRAIAQPIYALSPKSHHHKKTATLGGLAFLMSMGAYMLLFTDLVSQAVILFVFLTAFCFGALGFLDDALALFKQQNKGLSSKQKLLLQIIVALALMVFYGRYIQPVSLSFFALSVFVLVGSSNACNLTDGLDGLLAGLSLISLVAFFLLFLGSGWLLLQPVIIVLIGGLCGFLCFNYYPARLFMGDTGSLALGGIFASLVIVYQNPFVLVALGAPFILETVCVMLQVGYYKLTKKRLFLMAPFHHHLELMGLKEPFVVAAFLIFHSLIVTLYLYSLN